MTHVGHESQTRAWRSQTYHWYYPPRTYGMPCSTFKNISKSFSLHVSLPCHYFLVNQHLLTLVRETDIMRTIALRKSPPELQRCRLEHSICRDAEVPSSTQSAPLSPVGVNQDAHRTDSRIPLGPRSPSSIAPDMYPHMVCPIPQTAGRRLPAYPFPPGRATDGSAVCLFTRWFTAA